MMTEQNTTTKPGRVRRFFRWAFIAAKWLFVLLLSLLLIAGLYFQAPPKVIALMAIILATLTIIPKPARKWIWLTFAIILIATVVWVFLPEETGDWQPYTFDEELAALEAKRAIPDEQNAATIYNKLLETYDSKDLYPGFMVHHLEELTRREPWQSKDYPKLANWIQSHEEIINLLTEAIQIDKCAFRLEGYHKFSLRTGQRKARVTLWAQLLARAAYNDLAEGRIDEAIEKQYIIIRMSDHLNQQPTFSNMLIGIVIETIGTHNIIWTIVHENTTDEQLRSIENVLRQSNRDWTRDFANTLEYEKLSDKNLFGLLYEVNSKSRIRLSKLSWSTIFSVRMSRHIPFNLGKYDHKVTRLFHWFFIPHDPEKMGDIVEDIYIKEVHPILEPKYDWSKRERILREPTLCNIRYLIRYFYSYFRDHRNHDLYLRNIGQHRNCQLIIALRRYKNEHGRWPETIEDIKSLVSPELFIDPVNNDSYVYRLTEDGFTLYSKGKNNIDENGESRTKKPDGSRTDDHLIWPPKKSMKQTAASASIKKE